MGGKLKAITEAGRNCAVSRVISAIRACAESAADAMEQERSERFVEAARAYGALLATLGSQSGAPIVPAPFADLAEEAKSESAAFLPSGAGGGDVAVWVGTAMPSLRFDRRAEALGIRRLTLSIDRDGVRREPLS